LNEDGLRDELVAEMELSHPTGNQRRPLGVLVVQFAAFLDRLTLRRVLEFIAIALLVMAFIQTLPIDLAVLFAGDTLMYLEILVAIRLAAGREIVVEMARLITRLARLTVRLAQAALHQPLARFSRWRERRSIARKPRPGRSGHSDHDPSLDWGLLAAA
jgi:hypothetical protein